MTPSDVCGCWRVYHSAKRCATRSGLLKVVLGRDIEKDPQGRLRLARGVAKDRLVSTVDTDARHSPQKHRITSRRLQRPHRRRPRQKTPTEDPASEIIITATAVTPANTPDTHLVWCLASWPWFVVVVGFGGVIGILIRRSSWLLGVDARGVVFDLSEDECEELECLMRRRRVSLGIWCCVVRLCWLRLRVMSMLASLRGWGVIRLR